MKNSSRVGSSSSHGHAAIPAAAKKVVQNLKEIVKKHSDEEIYATLKDCDMDPNHAVHVLMNQDTFHEVRRRRDKRRENGFSNDTGETKARVPVGVTRFDRGGKRINYVPRHLLNDDSGSGKRKFNSTREDRYQTHRVVTSTNSQSSSQMRPNTLRIRNAGRTGVGQRPSQTHAASRGNWTKVSVPTSSDSMSAMVAAAPLPGSSMPTSACTGHETVKKQELSSTETDRAALKQQGGYCDEVGLADASFLKSLKKFNTSTDDQNMVSDTRNSAGPHHESARPHPARLHQNFSEQQRKYTSGTLGSRPYFHNVRASYHPHHQVSGTQRAALEWKPKPPTSIVATEHVSSATLPTEETGRSSPPTALPVSNEVPAGAISKLEGLNLLDDPPVIIPEHLQVLEAECAGLNFGSFDTDFEHSFRAGRNERKISTPEETSASPEVLPVQPVEPSVTELPPLETSTPSHSQLLSLTTAETFVTSSDAVLSMPSVAGRAAEIYKPEMPTQQGRQFSYVPSVSSYPGLGVMSQPQYPYDTPESQAQEISRSNFVQPFADPASNYYSPIFRPGSDVETRYQFLSSHSASKFSGNVTLMNGQTLSASQEQSQNAGISHTTLAVGQPSIPVHAYAAQPAGVSIPPYPTNIYGYQYVPSNYTYVHAPFQNSYPGNSSYPQPPIGSSFASSARAYPSGAATVKFPPPQYKLGTGNAPHPMVAAGYGSYATAPSGFVGVNSSVTAGSASSYDDMIGLQYKENTLYNTSHQVDSSALWVQGPLSRDVPGMQTNSFYNLHGPGQHAGYMHSQPAHTHHATGFASYPQSASGPNNHQLLQQPQALGSVGAGSQGVIFSQPQRGPVNWGNNYSNLLRSQ